MFRKYKSHLIFLLALSLPLPLMASTFEVSMEIPRLNVAEYHRPYVALWVADDTHKVALNLNVLYDLKLKDEEGEKWLKDMRQWWRRSGRTLDMPLDGVSGATRAPGTHKFEYAEKVAELPAGEYRLLVEAAREVGGRELLEIPFSWPATKPQTLKASGESELGTLILTIAP